jgi:hypothetical protein
VYLTVYLDELCELHVSLHSTRDAAEAAIADLLQRFDIRMTSDGELDRGLPPKEMWGELFDGAGEGIRLLKVTCDGGPAEEISLSEDLAAA